MVGVCCVFVCILFAVMLAMLCVRESVGWVLGVVYGLWYGEGGWGGGGGGVTQCRGNTRGLGYTLPMLPRKFKMSPLSTEPFISCLSHRELIAAQYDRIRAITFIVGPAGSLVPRS